MLRGILGDPICEAGVVLDEHEAAVCMVFLPGSVEHLGLDLVMLGTGLAPRGVQWLVEILDKVGRLAQGKGHLIQARPRRNISSAFVANRVNASGAQVLRGGGVPSREMMGIL